MQQICDFHLRFIRFICVDNLCQNKLLCDDCQKQTNEHTSHKVIDSATFMTVADKFLKGGEPDFVLYGADLQNKTKIFQQLTSNIRQEIRQNHVKKLEDQFEKYLHQMIDGLNATKKMIIDFINQSIDDSFSGSILSNRESGHQIVQSVLNALNAKISTKEGSILMNKLHTGELEKEYYEKKIQALVELFQSHVKHILDPMVSQVHKYITQFQQEMDKIKTSVKSEHMQINKTNMMPKQFKIKELQINQNLQLKSQTPQYFKPIVNHTDFEESYQTNPEFKKLKTTKVSKVQQIELLKSLDFTHQSSRITQSQHNQKGDNDLQSPQIALYDPSGADFKKIIQICTQHTHLLKILNIQKNVCLSAGKEGTLNIFTIEIDQTEMSIINQHQFKPHQEVKDVELCQTPGMFLTTGRNIRVVNDRYVDLGFTVKLFLFQDIKLIELLTEFRDLHQTAIEQLKFINEQYLRQRVDYSKYSNELDFATVSQDHLKVWKFSFDSAKIYEGEMQELYKIDLKGSIIRSVDFSDQLTILSERQTTCLFLQGVMFKQLKICSGKDQILRSKMITNHRLLILTQQAVLVVVDLQKIQQPPPLTNLKDHKPYEPLKINLKKYLRGILFEKEEKELDLIDVIQVKLKFIVLLHSSQYDHFLLLNKSFELENKYRFPPSDIRCLKLLDVDMHDLMIAINDKQEYSIWDVSK